MFTEQRNEPRQPINRPVKLTGGEDAVVRNISPSGMYLEIRGSAPQQGSIVIEMTLPEAGMKFTARGQIVRMEHREGLTGIAVKLEAPQLEPIET